MGDETVVLHSGGCTERFVTREEDDELVLDGFGVRWDSPTLLYQFSDGADIYEQVARGTWDDDARAETVSLRAHDWRGPVFGSVRAGTMTIREEDEGLRTIIRLDSRQQVAKDMWASVERGDVWGQSVGYSAGRGYKESREELEDGSVLYTVVRSPRLIEVSMLFNPAYRDTSVEAKQARIRIAMRGGLDAGTDLRKNRGAIERRIRIGRGKLAIAAKGAK